MTLALLGEPGGDLEPGFRVSLASENPFSVLSDYVSELHDITRWAGREGASIILAGSGSEWLRSKVGLSRLLLRIECPLLVVGEED